MAKKRSAAKGEFEEPPITAAAQAEDDGALDDDEFEAAAEAAEDDDLLAPAEESEAAATPSEELLQIKAEVEARLAERPPVSARSFSAGEALQGADNVVGVGIGTPYRDFESVGPDGPGTPVLNLYVVEPCSAAEAMAMVTDGLGVQSAADTDVACNVLRTGTIDALAHRHRERPSPCGISVGHFRITAGTQGALARGASGARRSRLLLLSNNHVIANSNAAQAGDPILQPGPFDGGRRPADVIAVLERMVSINFSGGANVVDAATAWCQPDKVRREFIYRRGSGFAYFRVGSIPCVAAVNMVVGKSGRTTQLRTGRIIDTSATIRVNYGGGRVALFRDQIAIQGLNGDFSQGGDSGSLIWTWNARRCPVGLLFAGGGGVTFANKIQHVLRALDIALYT